MTHAMPSARSTSSPTTPLQGNPLAVVHDADGLDDARMQRLRALDQPVRDHLPAAADRPGGRLPRAHLHARRRAAVRRPSDARQLPRLAGAGGVPRAPAEVVQECGVGLVRAAPRRRPARVRGAAAAHRAGRRGAAGRGARGARRCDALARARPRSGSTTARAGSALLLGDAADSARARARPCGAEAAREGRRASAPHPAGRRVRSSRCAPSRRRSASPKTRSPAA